LFKRVDVGAFVDASVLKQVTDRFGLNAVVNAIVTANAFNCAFVHLELEIFDVLSVKEA